MTTQPPRDDERGLDEALQRVAAADPAADAALDTTRLHATLAATTGVQVDADELAAARARRSRTRWLQAAAAVAAVAVVGAGGYAAGATGGPAAASPAITLNEPAQGDAGALAGASGDRQDAAVQVSGVLEGVARYTSGSTQEVATTLPATSYAGHLVFHAKDLSDEGGTHAAWAYDAAAVYSKDTAELLADVFGVTGAVRQDYGWTVGPVDGSRATVTLSPDGMATASYYDPTRDPWACSEVRSAPDEPSLDGQAEHAGSGTDSAAPDGAGESADDKASTWGTDVEPLDPGRIVPMSPDCGEGDVSSKEARSQAQDTLDALGLDPDAFEYEVAAGAAASVTAYGVVDGQRTGAMWSFVVAEDGVQSASGPMAPLVELGDYDVVSPSEAVARLNDPRFAETYGVYPLMARAEAAAAGGDTAVSAPADEPTVPATIEPGADLPWLVTDVMVTEERLGVALRTFDDGSTALVPAYELGDGAGGTWSVIAVTDAQLSFSG